ncbi:AAA family ATPase [Tunicatimonas pelagia]|uniref:AAA family ATPase n=1 Tax=Tunicatimonas pelagia TaxID=931531 RepID=UPI002665BDBA|nr:ATP-binding protein [Tunicatimonas pelagia]WKN40646.1 AAA family ATPase [Tunicatimonas pelagia]
MLNSLGIKNYRNLKSLEIEKLARVNLIAGKNNTGKTSLLEAVWLYSSKGGVEEIYQIIKDRGEIQDNSGKSNDEYEVNLEHLTSLFHNRILDLPASIQIGEFSQDKNHSNKVNIEIVEFWEETGGEKNRVYNNESLPKYLHIVENEEERIKHQNKLKPALKIVWKDLPYLLYPLSKPIANYRAKLNKLFVDKFDSQFVRSTSDFESENAKLWDNIALTDREDHVIKALKIIEPNVEKLGFVGDNDRTRKAVVKLKNRKEVLPLKSMGDGMNRILSIVLAQINAIGRYLLIDEFENGLHYTVQEDLWRMIFKLAKELNVQVFATTHSNDCIRAFENVLNDGNQSEGQYFRLEKFSDPALGEVIKPIFYSPEELEVATDQNIETR